MTPLSSRPTLPTVGSPTEAELAAVDLVELMGEIHDEMNGTYGEPRMTAELSRRGRPTNNKKARRLMAAHGRIGVHKPAKVRTTIPAEDNAPMPDLIARRFAPTAPDVAWVGDITYIRTGEGWLYLASVIDLGSGCLLGYSLADHMRTDLVADALKMAADARGGGRGPDFSAGGDVRESGTTTDPATSFAVRLTRHPGWAAQHIADRLHAHCIGAGSEIPAFAGHLTANADTWIALLELAMGLIPGAGGTVSLPAGSAGSAQRGWPSPGPAWPRPRPSPGPGRRHRRLD